MFENTLTSASKSIQTVISVLRTNDALRALLLRKGQDASGAQPEPSNHTGIDNTKCESDAVCNFPQELLAAAPNKIDWQIFDHCASFTRIYAIFEQFVTDLATAYIGELPVLYPTYSGLSESVRTQHRVAVGQILQKWSSDGPYRHLTEQSIVKGLSDGLAAAPKYSLLADAFLIDPHNYRPAAIRKIFGYLGFSDCWQGVQRHAAVTNYMAKIYGGSETAESVLTAIVEFRNNASHSVVSDVASVDDICKYAEFLLTLCTALCDIVHKGVIRRRIEAGMAPEIGVVVTRFGRASGVRLRSCELSIGDELYIRRGNSFRSVRVKSIRKVREDREKVVVTSDEEFGVLLTHSPDEGYIVYKAPHLHSAFDNAIQADESLAEDASDEPDTNGPAADEDSSSAADLPQGTSVNVDGVAGAS
ncbi:MAE_28990/MAE_18760 family HEPN-like nuclease [Planctomyces sp. SH-PL14]|uniref:MAE_28990/MAE_18760 family HEPN-like nuclease n=1 Tax=Planctomyces sp. SH-PL14 TaxID=1632864 RepID=UPI00078B8945|nr:MAE_28990/MAE_18760 family HEPN-like nuclease [Planctomyces sp. SH-PL14]AMV17860.1 hypothetical protein VT03_08200 [Planctomyces sp. SH-PL14]